MLIVKIFGGLGNQMFQYAFYKYLKMNNQDVFLDTSDFLVHKHHTGYELKRLFGIEDPEVEKKELKKVAVNSNSVFIRAIRRMFGIEIRKFEECNAQHHFVLVDSTPISENVYFDGYWQNIMYLEPVRDELRKIFRFKNNLSEKNEELSRFIQANKCIAVHIRRGDYMANEKLSSVCGGDYYNRAVEYIEKTVAEKKTYIIFSDDVEWAKKNLIFPAESIYVDWNKGEDSYIDMQLMGLCQHSIIANSTFSWWPAWLKTDPDQIVVMPKKWFLNENSKRLEIEGSIKL